MTNYVAKVSWIVLKIARLSGLTCLLGNIISTPPMARRQSYMLFKQFRTSLLADTSSFKCKITADNFIEDLVNTL
jgi:hypothetical protein